MENMYKGKRIDNGEWIFGQLLKIGDEYYIITKEDEDYCYCRNGTIEFSGVNEVKKDTICKYSEN